MTAHTGLRWLPLGAVAGPILLTLAWLGLGFVSPGYSLWGTQIAPYSAISQPLSGLGLGPTGPYMNAAFILSGLLIIAGVAGIVRAIPEVEVRRRWVIGALLMLPGFGSILDGIFTLESFLMHFVGFILALSTIVGFPVFGFSLRRVPQLRAIGRWLIAAGPVTLALAALYFLTFTPTVEGVQIGIAGLTERILVVELQATYALLGWLAFRRSSQNTRLAFN
ncbi:MAG TPA: DUF998 domain-containing protein [Candidatus Dormibacteraeota bacterium]|nr:DUF998 domain-containing protein [Candidatus Dormibacteraeota bacterium]